MKAFAYLRVSTDRQEVEAQRSQVRAFAEFKGYELLQIDDELAISGGMPFAKRPVGAEIMRRLDECDAVIFPKVDRLGRNTVDTILTVDALRLAGKHVHLLDIGMDTTTAMGRAFFQMSAVWAELERNRGAERIRERLSENRKRPGWHHGPAGFGYRNRAYLDEHGKKFFGGLHEIEETEASVINRIAHLRGNGATIRFIAEELNHAGVKTSRGGKWGTGNLSKIVGRMES